MISANAATADVCLIGANGSKVLVGPEYPIRLVAPFGFTSRPDLNSDLASRVHAYVDAGADIVQELSTFGPYAQLRRQLVEEAAVPYGTVLAYEVFDRLSGRRGLSHNEVRDIVLSTTQDQLSAGVSYLTVHAALSRNLLSTTASARERRAIPESSRAGGMIQTIMRRYTIENPLHEYFEDIAALCAESGAAISLGGSLRPAAIVDAMDAVHRAEINTQARHVHTAQRVGVPVMIEGLSHGVEADLHQYVTSVHEACGPVPVTALGPLPTDVAAGMDHVAAAIGVVFAAEAGITLVNIVTSVEHLAMPNEADVVDAIRAARVGLHVAETARAGRSHPRDRAMSRARARLLWSKQRELALFPELVSALIDREALTDGSGCTICGRRCPLVRREATQRC